MSPSSLNLDPRTPVVVGVGQVEQRVDDAAAACSPTSLLTQAALAARGRGGEDLAAVATSVGARLQTGTGLNRQSA